MVLLGSALQLAVTGVVCFVALVFGPVLAQRHGFTGPVVLAVITLVVITLADIALANLIALRARSTRTVTLGGCGTLLAGAVAGAGTLLLIVIG
jgi:hypothetical protein